MVLDRRLSFNEFDRCSQQKKESGSTPFSRITKKEGRQVKVQLTIAFWQAGGTSVADQIVGKQAHNKPTFRRVVAVESEVLKNLVFHP